MFAASGIQLPLLFLTVKNDIAEKAMILINGSGKNKNEGLNLARKKYFEDLIDGEHLICQPIVITKEAILSFAKEFDPQPFHTNEKFAEESMFKGLIASSLHTLSACTRVVVEAFDNILILSGVGMNEVKMFNPVRPGDILSIEAWWTDLKRSKTKTDRGFATIKCKVFNQKNQAVIEYGYRYLIACKN